MWWLYILSFFGGCLFGILIMALMVASRDDQARTEEENDVYNSKRV